MQYTRLVNTPNATLRREIKLIKEGNFIKVKEGKGHPSVLSKYQHNLLCDVIRLKDRENDRRSPEEVAEAVLVLSPSLTIKQAWNHYTNTLLVNYKGILTGKFKA